MGWSGYGDDSKQAAAGLLARARAGDKDAEAQLLQASQTWAPNHRNAAIDAWNELSPGTASDKSHIKNPHKGIGGFIGGALGKLAPLAAFIPGIGPIAAGAMGAGASMLGSELQGNGLDLGNSLLKGGLAGVGNKLLQRPDPMDVGPADTLGQAPGSTTLGVNGAPADYTHNALTSSGLTQPGRPIDSIINQFKDPTGKLDIAKIGQVGGAGLGIMEKRSQRKAQERMGNAQLQMQQSQLGRADQSYADSENLRKLAMDRLTSMKGSSIFGGSYGR